MNNIKKSIEETRGYFADHGCQLFVAARDAAADVWVSNV